MMGLTHGQSINRNNTGQQEKYGGPDHKEHGDPIGNITSNLPQ